MKRNIDQEIEDANAGLRMALRVIRDVETWYMAERRRTRLLALVALAIGLAVGLTLAWLRDG